MSRPRISVVLPLLCAVLVLVLVGCGGPQAADGEAAQPVREVDTVVVPTATPTGVLAAPEATATSQATLPPATASPVAPPAATETSPVPSVYTPDDADLASVDYEGWQTYKNDAYGFSLRYPLDWTLNEVTDPGDTMAGHRIDLHQDADPANRIMVAFRFVDEDIQILPSGMSQGEIIDRGSLLVVGEPVSRQALVADGADTRILYGGTGEIVRGDLVFWLTLDRVVPAEADWSIPAEVQRTADAVLSSLSLSEP